MYLCLPVVRYLTKCWSAKESYAISDRIMYEPYMISDFSLPILIATRGTIRGKSINMLNNY